MTAHSRFLSISISHPSVATGILRSEDLCLENVEANGVDCKTRLLFKHSPSIDQLMCEHLQSEILRFALEFKGPGSLLSIPDYVYTGNNITLGKLRVYGAEWKNNRTILTFRWSQITGNIFAIFTVGPDSLLTNFSPHAKLAFGALECILRPIFEVTRFADLETMNMWDNEDLQVKLCKIEAKRTELEKYAKLLSIYLDHLPDSEVKGSSAGSIESNQSKYLC